MSHLVRASLVAALAVSQGCALITLATVKRSHPQTEGAIVGLPVDAPVDVYRDRWGVPHVRADSEKDALFALGFLHAQDRLFQADLSRRVAWGRTAEWFGERSVELDTFMRGLQLREAASLDPLSAESRVWVDAYIAGLNAGIDSLKAPPPEYRLLGVEPEPWEAEDALAILFLQSWNLQGNSSHELAAWQMRDEWDTGTLDALYRIDDRILPADPYWEDLRTVEAGDLTAPFEAFTRVLGGRPDADEASNNWVVGGERTASGKPMLANDPHLGQSVPSLWYLVDLQGGDLHVAGASLPGLAGVPIGHNGQVAWGLTNVMADVVDYAVLERVGDDAVVLAGETVPLEEVRSTIRLEDGTERIGSVWRTPIGPVVTELEGTHVLVQRWHAPEVGDRSIDTMRRLATATTVDELIMAREIPSMVAQNVAMASVDGDFGYQSTGSVPSRRAHTGRVPYPGSDPDHGWDGWMAVLPGEKNPERGYTITANTHPIVDRPAGVGPDEGEAVPVAQISSTWVPPHRFGRIDEVLADAKDWTPEDMQALQRDVVDITARRLLPELLSDVEPSTESSRICLEFLEDWDHRMETAAIAPSVWAYFQQDLVELALEDELSERGLATYLASGSPSRSIIHRDVTLHLDDRAKDVDAALDRACVRLRDAFGAAPDNWTWGALHPLELSHPFGGSSKLLSGWNMEPVGFPGSGATVAAASWSYGDGVRPVGGMASLRLVVPLADPDKATLVHPGGQSGQPRHATYRSHYQAFVSGQTTPLWFGELDVKRETTEHLTLVPAR